MVDKYTAITTHRNIHGNRLGSKQNRLTKSIRESCSKRKDLQVKRVYRFVNNQTGQIYTEPQPPLQKIQRCSKTQGLQ